MKADPTAEALYEEGTRYFAEKRYSRAIDVLTKLKTDYPFSPQLTDAELKIADAYYLNQQYPEAINAFKEFQSLHPTNEHIPFVVYRLGQAHLDQFTSIERDQKNTEIAKGYFETVVNSYPKSPYAAPAREQLGKAVGYLAEHEFNVASFYLQQEKYPAARDRFEEIVRKYPGTPVAARSLFFLGESYRKEKNSVRAALAYEALLQHYPESKFAPEAKTYLAQLEKEKQDPLALLLMRDRRPTAAGATIQETAAAEKLKNIDNLTAKTEVVYEEPGAEKGIFSKVADKLNPFSSSDDGKKPVESPTELVAKKKTNEKEDSPGALGSLWDGINPFGGKKTPQASKAEEASTSSQLVNQIDKSLEQKGIDSKTQTAALKPPAAAMPKVDTPPPQTMDTAKLLGDIDTNLKKSGKNVDEAPAPPEAHPAFKDPATAELAAKPKANPEPPKDVVSGGLLSSIDEKLKSQGFEPSKLQPPPTAEQLQATPRQEPAKKVELEPKVAVEKGPLFLAPAEIPGQGRTLPTAESANPEKKAESPEKLQAPAHAEFPRTLVKGPTQPQSAAKATEQKPPSAGQQEDPKGAFEQLRSDMENVSKALNPFRW